jgi:XTP/dITP diphosphohydrolase
MTVKTLPHKVVLASGNQGKLRELNQMLSGLGIEVVAQSDFDVPDAEETGLSFVENAILKARHATKLTGLPAIADDSGLEVDALQDIKDVPEDGRTARFQCLLVFMTHEKDPTPLICQGTWEGRILFEPRGEGGFGYDPIFYVPSEDCASAELSPEVKNRLSHRGQALGKLLHALQAVKQ